MDSRGESGAWREVTKNIQDSRHTRWRRVVVLINALDLTRNEQIGSVPRVQRLYIQIKNMISVGDSRVNICWETDDNSWLKTWIFSRVRLIKRLAGKVSRDWTKGSINPDNFTCKKGHTLKLLGGTVHFIICAHIENFIGSL